MSVIFEDACATWAEMREEFELYRHSTFNQAHRDCNGVLLNRRGIANDVDPLSLFMGPLSRASKYASDELIEWWELNGRPSLADFEKTWWTGRRAVLS